jgi:hypothetical protein
MAASSAEIHYVMRVAPQQGKEVTQTRYEEATQLALEAIAQSFAEVGLPLAEIEADGRVVYRATNPRGGATTWRSGG